MSVELKEALDQIIKYELSQGSFQSFTRPDWPNHDVIRHNLTSWFYGLCLIDNATDKQKFMAKNPTGEERRTDLRTKISAKVKFTHNSVGSVLLESGDISDGGVFVFNGDIQPPPVGEKVTLQMTGLPMEAPIVPMKVVRHTKDGMGLQFDFKED